MPPSTLTPLCIAILLLLTRVQGNQTAIIDGISGESLAELLLGAKKIVLKNEGWKTLNAADVPKAEELHLQGNPIESINGVFEHLKILKLNHAKMKELDAEMFPKLKSLMYINGELEEFSGEWKHLEYLDLAANKLAKFDNKLPNIRWLRLSKNQLTEFNCKYDKLKSLRIADNKLATSTIKTKCSKLKTLDLGGNKMNHFGDGIAAKFGKHLRVLYAGHNEMKIFDGMWEELKELYIDHNEIIRVKAYLPKIIKIDASHNKLYGEGFQIKPRDEWGQTSVTTLDSLDLSYNDEGEALKVRFASGQHLKYLNVKKSRTKDCKFYMSRGYDKLILPNGNEMTNRDMPYKDWSGMYDGTNKIK